MPTVTPAPSLSPQDVLVVIELDSNPREISWDIVNISDGTILYTDGGFRRDQLFMRIDRTVTLGLSGEYNFTVYGTLGDGLCCDGFAAVYFGTDESLPLTCVSGMKEVVPTSQKHSCPMIWENL